MTTRVAKEEEFIKRARGQIEKRSGKTPEELLKERDNRVRDVIQLKIPDRMPIFMKADVFPLKYAGLPHSVMFYDPAAYRSAILKTLIDFEPDVVRLDGSGRPIGPALEKLGSTQFLWPGGPLRPDQHAQHVEREIMKADEYDLFLTDPGDFILRYYLPREWTALAALSKLPPIRNLVGASSMASQAIRFSSKEIVQAFETIFEAGKEQAKSSQAKEGVTEALGVALMFSGGHVFTPFDFITDSLRGMNGIAVDMFKQPEKVLAAVEKVLEWQLVRGLTAGIPANAKNKGQRVHGAGAHWGSKAFLSKKQFETFYWPTYKKSLLSVIDLGFVPGMHPEANWDDRIEHFLELPRGKAFVYNEVSDVIKMKEILGGRIAFMGGVPASLLHFGSTQEVEEHCKKLIKICGKGGGYMMSCAGEEDDAKPANLKAMFDTIRKYGRY